MMKVINGRGATAFFAWCLCLTAAAQTENLPSSSTPTKSVWSSMRPTSFEPTVASALEQCLRAAKKDPADVLTEEKCDTFKQQLEVGEACRLVWVPDGIGFDYMNGLIRGSKTVTENVKKSIGREDRARLCDLGDGVYAYWFVGDDGKSCNNVGIVIVAKPPEEPVEEVPPGPPTVRWVCLKETFEQHYHGNDLHLPGMYVEGCEHNSFIPGLSISGGLTQSRGFSETCGWVQIEATQ
jgi:hypothetical protein